MTSIRKKLYVPLVSIFILLMLTLLANYLFSVNKIKNNVYSEASKEIKFFFKKEYQALKDIGLTNAVGLSNNTYIIESLLDGSRSYAQAGIDKLIKEYKANNSIKNIKIHIHDQNIHSFLRHWKPKKFGDDLKGFRKTIVHVKDTKESIVAVELGRAGMVLRGLAPIVVQDTYIGSVEFMQGFSGIVENAKKQKKEFVILMKEEHLKIATLLTQKPKIGKYILATNEKQAPQKLLNDIRKFDIANYKEAFIGENYLFVSVPIKSFSGEIVAYAITAESLKSIFKTLEASKSIIINQILLVVGSLIVVFIVLTIIFQKGILQPINMLKKTASELAQGDADLSKRVELNSKDELEEVAHGFNVFIDKVEKIAFAAKEDSF